MYDCAQEDEGDDDGDTPHAPMNGGVLAVLPQRSAQSTTDGPESPQQASPLRAAGSSALGTMADADAEVEHFARLQVHPLLNPYCTHGHGMDPL